MVATDLARTVALAAAQAAADKKARDIVLLDVSDEVVITDIFMIASAPSERQVLAIVDAVEDKLRRELDVKPERREGLKQGRWVLLDFADVIIHVQHSQEREYYALDSLWKDCPAIEFVDSAEIRAASEGQASVSSALRDAA